MNTISLSAAFGAGLASFLSPCVLPLVPGYLSFLSGTGIDQLRAGDGESRVRGRVLANAGAFVLGFSLIFVLLGASATVIGQLLLNRHSDEYDAMVLSGTAYRMPGSMNSGDLNKRHAHLGTTGAEWLSRDPEVAQAFVDDPLTTLTPLQKLFGTLDAARLIGRPARHLAHDLPVLIQVGSDDPLGGEASARRLERAFRTRSGLTDVTTIVYDGARHEVFNETNRAEVFADLTAWLTERFPSRT